MSYRVIRVLLCDVPDCQTPVPFVLMGDDDLAVQEGWTEQIALTGEKIHTCPICAAAGRMADKPRELVAVE